MNTRKKCIGILAIAFGLTAWGAWHAFFEPAPVPPKFEDNTMNQLKIVGPYDETDLHDMPSVIPMTDEQTAYVMAVTDMAIKVIQKKTTLEEAEKTLFGEGKYHFPKAPGPVKAKVFRSENFRMKFIHIVFERTDEQSIWNAVELGIGTKNSPESAYQINLPSSFFDGMVLDKAVSEDRPMNGATPAQKVHIFQFHTASNGVKVQLEFETREDLSNLKDKYPKSFHTLVITRLN